MGVRIGRKNVALILYPRLTVPQKVLPYQRPKVTESGASVQTKFILTFWRFEPATLRMSSIPYCILSCYVHLCNCSYSYTQRCTSIPHREEGSGFILKTPSTPHPPSLNGTFTIILLGGSMTDLFGPSKGGLFKKVFVTTFLPKSNLNFVLFIVFTKSLEDVLSMRSKFYQFKTAIFINC